MGRLRSCASRVFIAAVVLLLCAGVHGAGRGGYLSRKSAAGIDPGSNMASEGVEGEISEGFIAKVLSGCERKDLESSTFNEEGEISEGFIAKVLSPCERKDLESSTCHETYGLMPCSTTAFGNLFLMLTYGYLVYLGAKFRFNATGGCSSVTGRCNIGSSLLTILGAFPKAFLVLVSGLAGSTETAQSKVMIGMGLLAGSTVMLLTLLWGSCLVAGKCDFSENSVAIDSRDTKGFSLFGSGISTDKLTRTDSQIMLASIVPLLIVQIRWVFSSSSAKGIVVLVACIAAILYLLFYCMYKVMEPSIQNRQIEYAKHEHIISSVLHHLHKKGLGSLLREHKQLDREVTKRIFDSLDSDGDGHLSEGEVRGLIVGLQLHQQSGTAKDVLDKIMAEFDTSRDGKLDLEEFEDGMLSWLSVVDSSVDLSNNYSRKISDLETATRYELDYLLPEDTTVNNPNNFYLKAVLRMLGGFILAGIFADPFVEAINNFSYATKVPPFFVAFLAMPLAANSSEYFSAFNFASCKKKKMASLSYSEIYGAVTMNNTLCFGILLAIVYIRGLEWDFSDKVLVIFLIVLVMGLFGSFRATFPLWISFVAFLMYPLILAIVYVLDYVLGWS